MILNFKKFNIDLEPSEKFLKFKTEDRSLVSKIIANLYLKPELAYSFNFFDIIFLKNFFFANYLLEKLELFNKIQFIIYMQDLTFNFTTNITLYNYICNDYKLYNILWYNILLKKNLNDFLPMGSLLFKLEFYLIPLIYNSKKNNNISIINNSNKFKIFKNKELKQDYFFFMEFIKKEITFYNKIPFDGINLNINIMLEDFLSVHINFENNVYSLININEYNKLLIELQLSFDNIKFYLNLANKHNLIVQNLNNDTLIYASFKLKSQNFKSINLPLFQVKDYEFKKSLSEFNTYMEFSFKTVKEFIEIFLFKFEFIFSISLDKLLILFYEGITNQSIFFSFYNLLIKQINEVKTQMNLYTLNFVVDFLEFLYILCEISFNVLVFNQSIFNLINNNYFKNLRLFRFNFWTRLKLFTFNNSSLYYKYFFFFSHKSINNFYNFILKSFNIVQINNEISLEDKNMFTLKNFKNSIQGFNINKNLSLVYFTLNFLSFIKCFLKYFKRLKHYKKKYNNDPKKIKAKQKYIAFINVYLFKFIYSFNIFQYSELFIYNFHYLFTFNSLKYINILKMKDIILYKNFKNKLVSKMKLKDFFYNIDLYKNEFLNIIKKKNLLRFSFFKDLILYNKKKNIKIIFFFKINLLNLSSGKFPIKNSLIIINISKMFDWKFSAKNFIEKK